MGASFFDTMVRDGRMPAAYLSMRGRFGTGFCLNKRLTQPVEGGMTEGGLLFGVPASKAGVSYFSVTSARLKFSHLFASVVQASRSLR